MTADERPRLRVATEYLCYPLWLIHADGGTDNPAPGDLGLPADLVADLDAWAAEYDAIFPPDDPGSAAFPSPQAEVDFYARGRELARRTARAVAGRYAVTFVDRKGAGEIAVPAG